MRRRLKSVIERFRNWLLATTAGVVALSSSTAAWAQTCPLCYRAAAESKAGAVHALRSGVLILMIPPVLIFGIVTMVAVRSRDRFNETEPARRDASGDRKSTR